MKNKFPAARVAIPMIDSSTIWPATMFANRRTDNTACLINSPTISMIHSMGLMTRPMEKLKSMLGNCAIQNPIGPCIMEPAINEVKNTVNASAKVTPNTAVGDPAHGTKPNRLQPVINRNIVQKIGVSASAFL